MRNHLFSLLLFSSVLATAQTQQNIHKNTGTVSTIITTIDSIRFTGSFTIMEVILQDGTVASHAISDIINVNFITANQDSCLATNVFNPNVSYGQLVDQEGNVYKTISIGSQEWMAENLKASIYRNGDVIATNLIDSEWPIANDSNIGAWAYYNNNSLYNCPYGKLYNWSAVNDSRNVCPAGWHVPSDAEWATLSAYLVNDSLTGGKLKSSGLDYWISPNLDASNESGFSSLPGGARFAGGIYSEMGYSGYWWSATEYATDFAWGRMLSYDSGLIQINGSSGQVGCSVRCVMD
ncbi:MAG TPA: FISUMP domain-containing protein [Flavobacteriales bacterium]|nr:FISUMP domain-containing protein [Flavobacteriales bacterium]